ATPAGGRSLASWASHLARACPRAQRLPAVDHRLAWRLRARAAPRARGREPRTSSCTLRTVRAATLLAVPNVSEGRDGRLVDAIAEAFARARAAQLLDVHFDTDHHRSVYTLAGPQGSRADALRAGARVGGESIDVMRDPGSGGPPGQHR